MEGNWEEVRSKVDSIGSSCINLPKTGVIFNSLKRNVWKLKCKCGNEWSPRIMDLMNGRFINCGKCEGWTYGRVANFISQYFEIIKCPGPLEDSVRAIRLTYWDLLCKACTKPCRFTTAKLKTERRSCGCQKRVYNWEKTPGRHIVKDYIGTRNGWLEVLERSNEVGSDFVLYKCECKRCGKIVHVRAGNLKKTKSCGCLSSEQKSDRKSLKLEGIEYENFKVKERVGVNSHGKVLWSVNCKRCDGETVLTSNVLKSGATKSCGCIKSHIEAELLTFLRENCSNVITHDRTILTPLELDAYMPELGLAVELNGIHWHGELVRAKNGKSLSTQSKLGCFDKYLGCKRKDIRLINIFEDEWATKREVVEGYLKSILHKKQTIGARKCKIELIDSHQFLDKYHLQGAGQAGKTYSLTYDGKIVATAVFVRAARFKKKTIAGDVFELTRYCVSPDLSITGGCSRLVKAFLSENKCDAIISYSDNRWSTGDLYRSSGFTFEGESNPTYWYVRSGNPKERVHRFNWTKTKALKAYEGSETDTEWDIMQRNGWDRVWDCGKTRWVYYVDRQSSSIENASIK